MTAAATINDQARGSGLPAGPSLPVAVQTLRVWRAVLPFFDSLSRRYGPMFTIRAMPWGTAVVVNDTELVGEILARDREAFHPTLGNESVAAAVGVCQVPALDDQRPEGSESLLALPGGGALTAFERVVERLVTAELGSWPLLEAFSLLPRLRAITLEVILRAVIGVSGPARTRALSSAPSAGLQITPTVMAMRTIPGVGSLAGWRRSPTALAKVDGWLLTEITARRCDPRVLEREDVLSRLIARGDWDDRELRAQLLTLLAAGHETISIGLAWTFERLLRDRAALARACQCEDGYLDAVIQETLRVRPVLPIALRRLRAPASLGGYELPAGVILIPRIALIYRSATRFDEPLRFRPERFMTAGGDGPSVGGRGPSREVTLARYLMRVVLRTILESTALRPDLAADELAHNHNITLVPARGSRVVREGWRVLPPWPAHRRLTARARFQGSASAFAT
jgi:cytochrome P450